MSIDITPHPKKDLTKPFEGSHIAEERIEEKRKNVQNTNTDGH